MASTTFDALMKNRVSLFFVFIVTSILLAVGSARAASVGTFTCGDPGEGLVEMQGDFLYPVEAGPSGSAGKAGDPNLAAGNTSGVSIYEMQH